MNEAFNALLGVEAASDLEFANAYAVETARLSSIDSILNALDDVRRSAGLSKAGLARSAGIEASVVRRLFSAQSANPTLSTVSTVAAALGMRLTLEPLPEDRSV